MQRKRKLWQRIRSAEIEPIRKRWLISGEAEEAHEEEYVGNDEPQWKQKKQKIVVEN